MRERCGPRRLLSGRASSLVVPLALMAAMQLGAACARTDSTPAAPTTPPNGAISTPTTTVASPPATPADLGCLPGETAELVWPTLQEIKPSQVAAGDKLTVTGSDGYVRCGEHGVIEGSRLFQLYLDDEPASTIDCYVNRCQGELTVPDTVLPGEHTISVEGGSSIGVLVIR